MHEIKLLFEAILLGVTVLLPLTNPLSTVALMLGLVGNMSQAEIRRQAANASMYVFGIMVVAFYGGQAIMNVFGISLPGLRIGGGLIVTYIGFRMLFPPAAHFETPEASAKRVELHNQTSQDIAFVPLAMPTTAGPGTIAMLISVASSVRSQSFSTVGSHGCPDRLSVWLSVLILWLCLAQC